MILNATLLINMKTHLLSLLLTIVGLSQANGQNCCQGFEAAFTFEHANNPLGLIVHNASSGEWNTVHWNFGDGSTGNGPHTDHIYAQSGLYQVCVVIENNQDCRSELCRDIAVGLEGNPCGDFVADFSHEIGLETLTAHFTDLSPNAQFHIWHFGDGTSSNDANPEHHYTAPGVYQVCEVIEHGDCRSEYCREVCVVDHNPCEGFNVGIAHVLSQVSPQQVNFHGNYPSGTSSLVWHFGDGTSSNTEHPEHVYAENGTYVVCLVAESSNGCRSESCISVTVGIQSQPCQNFEAGFNYVSTNNPLGIGFNNTSLGEWNFIVWHFGDGESSNGNSPDHLYDAPGIYEVCVVIERGNDCRSEYCMNVAVNVQINPCDGFTASFGHTTSPENLTAIFQNTSSVEAPFHVWHFGDGTSSETLNPVHTYSEPGTYQVCMVLESNNCRSEYCISVTVGIHENPCAEFEAHFAYVVDLVAGGVHFENLSVGDIDHYIWSFGSDSPEPNIEFEQTGLHNVCLVIENNAGCRAEYCETVHVPAYYFYMVHATGINEALASAASHVYPNPFVDVLYLEGAQASQLEVMDMQGRTVVSTKMTAASIELGFLVSGVYVLRTTDSDGRVRTARIVRQ